MKQTLVLAFCLTLVAAASLGQGCPPPPNLPIGSCAPKSGTATNFVGDTGPLRVRKSIYMLSAAEIAKLNLAFQKLRALPSTDPRRWLAQANVHCWNCSGDNSTVADVHGTWAFMPWHRVYLYVLEKTLDQLVNDPSFAIPYWDWNTPDSGTCTGHLHVPPPYLGGGTSNALFDCYRFDATLWKSNGPSRFGKGPPRYCNASSQYCNGPLDHYDVASRNPKGRNGSTMGLRGTETRRRSTAMSHWTNATWASWNPNGRHGSTVGLRDTATRRRSIATGRWTSTTWASWKSNGRHGSMTGRRGIAIGRCSTAKSRRIPPTRRSGNSAGRRERRCRFAVF